LAVPVALSIAVLVAGVFSVAPLRDAATLANVSDVYLGRPSGYIDFAPFSDLLDAITLLSERQHVAVLLGVLVLWGVWRLSRPRSRGDGWRGSARSFGILLASIAVAYAAAAYLPRPMAYLSAADPDVLRIDFHSHTRGSRDARASYSVERNRAWHSGGGYDVAYVTDHHIFAESEPEFKSDRPTGTDSVMLMPGIETNSKSEHVGILGNERAIRRELSGDLHELDLQHAVAADCCNPAAPLVIWNHPRDLALTTLSSGAVQAIEVANGALHGMDLVRGKRQEIVALARQDNLALLSGTDSHGWGYAAPNWTLLRLKGWRMLDRDQLAARIGKAIRVGGFGATRVVERATVDPGTSAVALDLTVFLVPWRMLTELSADERRMWLIWIWGIAGIVLQCRRVRRAWRDGLTAPAP
jgi:hypothetical protein